MRPTLAYATTSDGVRIAYASVGSGPTLIALPGVPFSDLAAEWRIPALARAFEDLAGAFLGRSVIHSFLRVVSDGRS